MNTEQRAAFRRRLEDLTETELLQWSFLAGLAARIDLEICAYRALFESEADRELEPKVDTELTGIQMLLQSELRKRSVARIKLQKLQTEGEHHANNNGTH